MAPRKAGADVVAFDPHKLIAGRKPRLLRRRPLYGPQHFHHPVLGADFDAYAGIGAHGAQADFLELLAVEVGRVRIECGDHAAQRSEEHTSELQSQSNLVCRLLLEKKKAYT